MLKKKIRSYSFLLSVILHALLFMGFFLIKLDPGARQKEFVEITFEGGGNDGEEQGEVLPKERRKPKDVNVPEAKQKQDNNVNTADEADDKETKTTKKPAGKPGKNNKGSTGSGFSILDWGGQGGRRILSYTIPPYPDGVNKEADIKIRFSILPDGTVSKAIPLVKIEPTLEAVAVNALKKWRFEPLDDGQTFVQEVQIVFPFRLK